MIMKTFFLALFFVSFFTKAYACEQGEINFVKNNICAKINWIKGPSINEFNTVSVNLSENKNLKLNVLPWMVMSGHEHGSRPVTMTTVSPTDYLVEKIYFMGGMHGQWYLKLQLLNDQNTIVEEVRSPVSL